MKPPMLSCLCDMLVAQDSWATGHQRKRGRRGVLSKLLFQTYYVDLGRVGKASNMAGCQNHEPICSVSARSRVCVCVCDVFPRRFWQRVRLVSKFPLVGRSVCRSCEACRRRRSRPPRCRRPLLAARSRPAPPGRSRPEECGPCLT